MKNNKSLILIGLNLLAGGLTGLIFGSCESFSLSATGSFLNSNVSPQPLSSGSSNLAAPRVSPPTLLGISPTHGPTSGGTLITLNGSGFDSSTTVWIGDVLCQNLNYLSPSVLNCQTGQNSPGSKTILLIQSSGQTTTFPPPNSLQKGFTYIAPGPILTTNNGLCPPTSPLPRSTICPSSGSIYFSTLVTLVGNNFQRGAKALIGDQPCCGVPINPGQSCPNTSPQSVNNTTIPNTLTCYAPPSFISGSISVSIINPDFQSITSVDQPFIYSTGPINLNYSENPAYYLLGSTITPNVPSITSNSPVTYSVSPALPDALTLNPTTGIITGIPPGSSSSGVYIVTARNSKNETTSINLSITWGVVGPE